MGDSIGRYLKKQREEREKREDQRRREQRNRETRQERGRFDDESVDEYRKKKQQQEEQQKRKEAVQQQRDNARRQTDESIRKNREAERERLREMDSPEPPRRAPRYEPPEKESDADRESSRARDLTSRQTWNRPAFEPAPRHIYDVEQRGQVETGLPRLGAQPSPLEEPDRSNDTVGSTYRQPFGPNYQPIPTSGYRGPNRSPLGLNDQSRTVMGGLGYMQDVLAGRQNPLDLLRGTSMQPQPGNGLDQLGQTQYVQDLTSGVPAAAEKFQYENQRTDERYNGRQFGFQPEREQRAAAAGGLAANLMNIGSMMFNPDRTWQDVQNQTMMAFGNALNYATSPLTASRPTAEVARAGEKFGNVLQAGTDAMAGVTLRNDFSQGATAGQTYRALLGGALDTLGHTTPLEGVKPGTLPGLDVMWETFKKNSQAQLERFKLGTTPTPEQRLANTPEELRQNFFRANLNWGNADSTAAAYDALNDRDGTVAEYEKEAERLFQLGGQQTDETKQTQYWQQASDLKARAEELKKANPIQLVQEHTNVWQQFWSEMLTPDPSDLVASGLSILNLTPMARRLAKTAGEFIRPSDARVLKELSKLKTGPLTDIASMAEPVSNWFVKHVKQGLGYTGSSRAILDAQNLTHIAATVLADVENKADARTLLGILATDPKQLVTGIDVNLLTGQRIRDRAVDGLVKFGTVGMGTQQFRSALNSYRRVANELIGNAASLAGEGPINKLDFFFNDFIPGVEHGGYRQYGVATQLGQAPLGTRKAKAVSLNNTFAVEYLDEAGNVVGRANMPNMNAANKTAEVINKGGGVLEQNKLKQFGDFQRGIVSPLYITLSPMTWATNLAGAVGLSIGDNNFAFKSFDDMNNVMTKLYGGVWGNKRSIQRGGEAAMGGALVGSNPYRWIPGLGPLIDKAGKTYSKLDEISGSRNVYKATMRAIDEMLPKQLLKFKETLVANGMDAGEASHTVHTLHEVARAGGNMLDELNKVLSGRQSSFSLGAVNPNWVEVLSAGSVDNLANFKKALTTAANPEEYKRVVDNFVDNARKQWEAQVGEAPPVMQRYSWQQAEDLKDTAEIRAVADRMKKQGATPEEAEAFFKTQVDERKALAQKQDTIRDLVVNSNDPANSKLLYDVWMDAKIVTDKTRQDLAALWDRVKDQTVGMDLNRASQYWQENFFKPAREAWANRNKVVNGYYEQALQNLQSGQKYAPVDNYWQRLERATAGNTEELRKALAQEPGAGKVDARLGESIRAGQQLTDRELARTFAVAQMYPGQNVFDYLVSGEKSMQAAGAQVSHYVDTLFDQVKANKLSEKEFYKMRNQAWRELRDYEKNVQVWVRSAIRNDANRVFNNGEAVLDEAGRKYTITSGPLTAKDGQAYYKVKEQDGLVPANQLYREGEEAIVEPPPPPDVMTSTETPLTNNELFALAEESGIPTANKEGRPMFKAILNVVNKELKRRGMDPVTRLDDLTDVGRRIAEDVLVQRATKVAGEYDPLVSLGGSQNVADVIAAGNRTSVATTAAGGTQNMDDIALAGQHALEQLEDMRKWLLKNSQQVLSPTKGALSPNQSLAILNEFRTTHLPAWDTIKAAAAEYANRARGFSVLDASGRTGLDNMLGTMIPYSFFWTRSIKNMLERMVFEPHIYRRMQDYQDAVNLSREQQKEPERYKDNMRVQIGDDTYYLNLNPAKYWPSLQSLFYSDFADPDEANTMLGKAFEAGQSMNTNFYPWLDAAQKTMEGKQDEIYPLSYMGPWGNVASWAAARATGYDMNGPIAKWAKPQWLEHNTGRELMLMVQDGTLDYETAMQGYQILRTQRTGDQIPEQQSYDMEKLGPILDEATKRAADKQLTAGVTGALTSVAVKPYDTGENIANEEVDKFFRRQYDPQTNPYGYNPPPSDLASARLSQYAVTDENKTQPGVSLSTSQYKEQADAIDKALNAAAATAVDPVAEADGSIREMNTAKVKAALEAAKQFIDPAKVDAYAATIENDQGYAQGIDVGDIVKWTRDQVRQAQFPSSFDFLPNPNKLPEVDTAAAMHGGEEQLGKSRYGSNQELNAFQQQDNAITEVLQYGDQLRKAYDPQIPTADKTDAEKAARSAGFDNLEAYQASVDEMTKQKLIDLGMTPAQADEALLAHRNRFFTDAEIQRREELDIISQGWDDLRACKKGDYECRKRVFANNPLLADEHRKRYGEDSLDYLDGPKNKEFAAAQNWVYGNKPEYKDLWDQYYDLPKGYRREQFAAEHPEMALLNFAAYNPKEYEAAQKYFTDEDLIAWGARPDDPEERRSYFDENPNAFLVHSWMYGRPVNYDENKGETEWQANYGADYDEAQKLFGEGIWQLVSEYKRGWSKEQKRKFYDDHPEYGEWTNWWYGNEERKTTGTYDPSRYDSLGHRAYGSWGGGGGGGGGGSGGGGYISPVQLPNIRPGSVWSSNWGREPEDWTPRPAPVWESDWSRLIQTPLRNRTV